MNDRSFQPAGLPDLTFDPRTFVAWCRERWRICAVAGAVAACLSLVVSLAQPKQYSATSTILIGGPAGNDLRASTALNSVYLDSLRAWERVAGSDTLFARALENARAGGTEPAGSLESLKKKILRVTKPAGVALLEISVTLPDAGKAQAMVQFLAEQTVAQSRAADEKASADLNRDFRDQLQTASARMERAEAAREVLSKDAPSDVQQNEVQTASGLSARLTTELALARAELAGYRAAPEPSKVAGAEARIASLEMQRKEAADLVAATSARLERLRNRREVADAEFRSARGALDTANTRLNEAVSSAKFRGERLRIVDPGVVPQKPGSPNIPLNVLAALVFSLGGSIVYLAVTYGLRHQDGGSGPGGSREKGVEEVYSVR